MGSGKISGIYDSIEDAQNIIGSKFEKEYYPIEKNVEIYKKHYKKYKELGKYIEENIE